MYHSTFCSVPKNGDSGNQTIDDEGERDRSMVLAGRPYKIILKNSLSPRDNGIASTVRMSFLHNSYLLPH